MKEIKYDMLSTYVRNQIHHPEQNGKKVTEEQLKTSIKFLRGLITK
jgi:hypothetical protein